jgi:protein phosphatase
VQKLKLQHEDQLLLATDGLTENLDSNTIGQILSRSNSSDEACGVLIDKALASGSTDNITVVLARYRFPQNSSE